MTQRLADIVWVVQAGDLPPQVVQMVKTCFLDFLAACYCAAESEVWTTARDVIKAFGRGDSFLIGEKGKSSVVGSAFFNGTIATIEDLDDAHRYASGLHLSATAFPAALSLGDDRRINGRKFIEAVVTGYEVSSRLCRAIDITHRERGFHSTGTAGLFGASAASSVVLGLDKEKFVHAMGIAGSAAAGLFAFLQEGSSVRHAHSGWASANGLTAALLAQSGMTGPKYALEAKNGFLNAYSGKFDADKITRDRDGQYEIGFAYHKLYSACGHSFPSIDATLALKSEIPDFVDRLDRIDIKAYHLSAALNRQFPQSIAEAKFSIPFLVGLALIHGNATRREMIPDNLKDERVLKIASRVSVTEDKVISENFPKYRSAELIASMVDGTVVKKRIDSPLGMPENPVSWEQIEEKFHVATEGILNPTRQGEIVDGIKDLENLGRMNEITSLL